MTTPVGAAVVIACAVASAYIGWRAGSARAEIPPSPAATAFASGRLSSEPAASDPGGLPDILTADRARVLLADRSASEAMRNRAIDSLRLQQAPDLPRRLIDLERDPLQSAVMRAYACQHLALSWSTMTGVDRADALHDLRAIAADRAMAPIVRREALYALHREPTGSVGGHVATMVRNILEAPDREPDLVHVAARIASEIPLDDLREVVERLARTHPDAAVRAEASAAIAAWGRRRATVP